MAQDIVSSPYRQEIDKLIAEGYPPLTISKILYQKYKVNISGIEIYKYKQSANFDVVETSKEFRTVELAAVNKLRRTVEELEEEAEYLKKLRDFNSIKLRTNILYRAGVLSAKLADLESNLQLEERTQTLIAILVEVVANTLFRYIPHEYIEQAKIEFKNELEKKLEELK